MRNDYKNKNVFFIGFLVTVILVTAFIFGVTVLYTKNPEEFEKKINNVAYQIKDFLKISDNEIEQDNIVFPEKEDLTEVQKYYYYEQLSDTSKRIYLTIEKNIERIKNGEDNIPLPPSLNEVAKSSVTGKDIVAKEFQNAWDAFITDRSEYFYIDSSKVCLVTKMTTKGSDVKYEFFIGKGDNNNYFINGFETKEQVENAIKDVENVKNSLVNSISGNNYEKMKYVHDWLVDNVKYDTTNGENSTNIYGCLINKNVVCEGYARTFKYLMDELGIPCVLVSGIAKDENGKTERHAWNYVYIKNAWFAIDTTWDDPIVVGNGSISDKIRYKYFLKGSDTMNKDHTTSGQITKDGFTFVYPTLSIEDIK